MEENELIKSVNLLDLISLVRDHLEFSRIYIHED